MDPKDAAEMYQAAWRETDEGARRALLEKAWATDGVYLDPGARVDGREALIAHIGGFPERFPDHTIVGTTGVDVHDGYLRFGWQMVDPDGRQVLEGVDFGAYDESGQITLLVGFFGPWPPLLVKS